jgi:hypothetical protein
MPWSHTGEWRYSSTIFNLSTTRRRMSSFPPRPPYTWVKRPWYPLNRGLGGPQNRSGRCGGETNFAPAGNLIPDVQRVARRYADWAIPTPHNGRFYICMCLKHIPKYFEFFKCNTHQYTQYKNNACLRVGLWTGLVIQCFSTCETRHRRDLRSAEQDVRSRK